MSFIQEKNARVKEKPRSSLFFFVMAAFCKTVYTIMGSEQFCWQLGKSGNHMLWLNSPVLVKLLVFSSQVKGVF